MADRLIKVREQGRLVTRGLTALSSYHARLPLDCDDTVTVTVDWTAWLGGDTISSVTNEPTSCAVANESNTTKRATFNVSSAPGFIEHRITTANGQTKELLIEVGSAGMVRS